MRDQDSIKNKKRRDNVLRNMLPNFDELSEQDKVQKWRKIKPGRKVITFDPIVRNGMIDLQRKEKPFPVSIKVRHSQGPLPKEIVDALPIKPSKVCKWVGQTPFPIGSMPHKEVSGEPTFKEFVKENKQYQHFYRDKNLDMTIVKGSWATNGDDVKRAAEDVPNELTYELLLESLKRRCHKLILPRLSRGPAKNNLASSPVNGDSFSGLITSKLFGHTKKRAFQDSIDISKEIYDRTSKEVMQDTSLWSIGGRERPQSLVKDGEKVRSRAVWMPELCTSQLSQIYSRPIQRTLQRLQKESKHVIELMCGNSFYNGGWDKWCKRYHKYHNILFADWSRHDQTVVEETMVVAFAVLRACYPRSEKIDNHFLFIMSGFIHKHTAIPGRFIYLISKGIPSGSPFTTLITTVCCWLNWSVIFNKFNINDVDLSVYGDDTFAGLPVDVEIPDDIEDQITRILGMKVDPFKISTFTDERHPELGANFLQTYSYYGLPGRDTDTIFRIMSTPKNISRGYYDNSFKIIGTVFTGPGNLEATELILSFRDWLRFKAFAKVGADPPPAMVGAKAADLTFRLAIRNYFQINSSWYDKERSVLYWLDKETYSSYTRAPRDYVDELVHKHLKSIL